MIRYVLFMNRYLSSQAKQICTDSRNAFQSVQARDFKQFSICSNCVGFICLVSSDHTTVSVCIGSFNLKLSNYSYATEASISSLFSGCNLNMVLSMHEYAV